MPEGRTEVRAAALADATGIARVHVDSWRETYTGMVPERFFGEEAFGRRVEMWTRYLSTEPQQGRLAVAERAHRIVGFAFAGPATGPDAEKGHPPVRELQLFAIYLLATEHGGGVGRELLNAVVTDEPAQLWVAKPNSRAQEFYLRNGFRADGVEVEDPHLDGLIEIRMVR